MACRNDPVRIRLLGWVFALIALLGQVAGAVALPECCRDITPALGVICSIDHTATPGPSVPDHHHRDCAVCPFCAAMVTHVAVLDVAQALPMPRLAAPEPTASSPPARAPPPVAYRPGRPRGPPVLT